MLISAFRDKGWRMDEMLEETETIVASGTLLNLDYAIDDMLMKITRMRLLSLH